MNAQDDTHHAGRPFQEEIAGGGGLPVPGGSAVIRALQELSQKPITQWWRRGLRRRRRLVLLVIPTCTPQTLFPLWPVEHSAELLRHRQDAHLFFHIQNLLRNVDGLADAD